MTWGWLKPLLDFLKELFGEVLTTEVKSTDAKTSDDTKKRFQGLRDRIKPPAP